ncbi:stage III sporulation protein AG [Neobacillus dielmonensis]|uniref:stage III sporulation protein AG n=1 Tax=Neobacillus dielmonensis TaxID=1347369 RepID=UPI0005AAE249|nr:stage III sporulation protein AG [Neobacillus dielmonensis]
MSNNHGPFSWFKKLLKLDNETSEDKPGKKPSKYQYMVLVLCIGAAFMIVGNVVLTPGGSTEANKQASTNQTEPGEDVPAFGVKKSSSNQAIEDYEEKYETQLEKALQEVLGVKDVTVVVTIDSTARKVLEKNQVTKEQTTEETDREGGQRKVQDISTDEQVVIIRNGEKEVPIVVETKKPDIRGVMVVAKGAENIQVKKWIVEAVTKVLGVPSHRVGVFPKK